jgi:hypothetical protein
MRKLNDDPAARNAAGDHLLNSGVESENAETAVNAFTAAEFETATTRVTGQELTLRRIVLTTEWEVVPK